MTGGGTMTLRYEHIYLSISRISKFTPQPKYLIYLK